MPNFDGTGPAGQGPLTGGGQGHCVLKKGMQNGQEVWEGFMGTDGKPVCVTINHNTQQKKEMITMPGRDRTGPMGINLMTGRASGYLGYSVPGFINLMPYRRQYFYTMSHYPHGIPFVYLPAYGYGPYPTGRFFHRGFRGRGGRRGGRGRIMFSF
ncbi:DUF5320 domain-containing protein [candidate division KSB1 bacterium]|nr:DUF5320 domain-containing protein [candidate division KSB1 bacterium]